MNRPSLYATFGNKQALFEAAVDQHWARLTKLCIAALSSAGVLRQDLAASLACFIKIFAEEGPGGASSRAGCPLRPIVSPS